MIDQMRAYEAGTPGYKHSGTWLGNIHGCLNVVRGMACAYDKDRSRMRQTPTAASPAHEATMQP